MKILTSIFIAIFLISCNTETVVNTDINTDTIQKEKEHLGHIKFTNAIRIYGEPRINNKIKVEEKNLTAEQLTIVNTYFPNKEYESQKVFFLEAQWKRSTDSELIVWYLFIENEWKPIEVRANV